MARGALRARLSDWPPTNHRCHQHETSGTEGDFRGSGGMTQQPRHVSRTSPARRCPPVCGSPCAAPTVGHPTRLDAASGAPDAGSGTPAGPSPGRSRRPGVPEGASRERPARARPEGAGPERVGPRGRPGARPPPPSRPQRWAAMTPWFLNRAESRVAPRRRFRRVSPSFPAGHHANDRGFETRPSRMNREVIHASGDCCSSVGLRSAAGDADAIHQRAEGRPGHRT